MRETPSPASTPAAAAVVTSTMVILFTTCVQQRQYLEKNAYEPYTTFSRTTLHLCTFLFYLVEILPLAHIAEFCASPMNNSTTFRILELGIGHGNQHFSPVPC